MKVLVVASTEFEVKLFLKQSQHLQTTKNIDLLISGIGIAATVYHLTKELSQNNYDLVIQAGIAGSFTKRIKRGAVVFVKQDAFTSPGIIEQNDYRTIADVGLSDPNDFPFTDGVLSNNSRFDELKQLKSVNAVTVDIITDDKKKNKLFRKKYNADIESMEGAALHYVCLQQKTQFLQLRSISNYVGERDKKKWKIKKAIRNLNNELSVLVEQYVKKEENLK